MCSYDMSNNTGIKTTLIKHVISRIPASRAPKTLSETLRLSALCVYNTQLLQKSSHKVSKNITDGILRTIFIIVGRHLAQSPWLYARPWALHESSLHVTPHSVVATLNLWFNRPPTTNHQPPTQPKEYHVRTPLHSRIVLLSSGSPGNPLNSLRSVESIIEEKPICERTRRVCLVGFRCVDSFCVRGLVFVVFDFWKDGQ